MPDDTLGRVEFTSAHGLHWYSPLQQSLQLCGTCLFKSSGRGRRIRTENGISLSSTRLMPRIWYPLSLARPLWKQWFHKLPVQSYQLKTKVHHKGLHKTRHIYTMTLAYLYHSHSFCGCFSVCVTSLGITFPRYQIDSRPRQVFHFKLLMHLLVNFITV